MTENKSNILTSPVKKRKRFSTGQFETKYFDYVLGPSQKQAK
jgi:hypothetical protein